MGTIDTMQLSHYLVIKLLISVKLGFSITGKTDLYWSGNLAQIIWLHFLHIFVFITLDCVLFPLWNRFSYPYYMKILSQSYRSFTFILLFPILFLWVVSVCERVCLRIRMCLFSIWHFFLFYFVFRFILFYIKIFLITIAQYTIENWAVVF